MNFKVLSLLLLLLPVSVLGQHLPGENYIRGVAFYQQAEYDSAVSSFTSNLADNAKNTDALFYRGLAYFHEGDFDKSLADFAAVDKSDPGRGAIWIARIYARKNNIDECLKYLDLHLKSNYKLPESEILLDKNLGVFENDPKWTNFWKNATYYTGFDQTMAEARYLINSGDYVEAADVLSEGLKSGGYRKSPLYTERARVYLATGNDRQALEDLNAAIAADRRNAELYARRADLNYKLEKYKNALDDYETALKYDPDHFSLYPKRALARNKNGMYDNAVEDMEFYLKYFKDDHHNWYNYGMINRENNKMFDALKCFNKALALDKAIPEYFMARGETYLDTRTYKYARNDFSMALDLDPRNAKAYLDLGLAALKLGDNSQACYGFNKAYEYGLFEAREYIDKYCR
ncbi:MAG TPA: tetratricopeptide repeat protein [Bacteroidales bacterium]|nr:tetratricopeptide repeat protein [Bacteroidales bacterium]